MKLLVSVKFRIHLYDFYDKYRLDQNKYEMSNLQPLPDDNHELWTKPPLNGYKHLK
jgi:hypothetical protein